MPDPTPPDLPRLLLGCIPQDEAMRAKITEVTGTPCIPYRDSVAGECSMCRCAVWVGPIQQQVLRDHPTSVTICLPCAARLAAGPDAPAVRSLSGKKWGE